jgi:acyl-CoA reductase-like NAD-dependent aldehyde dehydrogenase
MEQTRTFKQLINGQWVDAIGGGTWDVINPATEEVVATVPFGDERDARAAITAAAAALPAWAGATAYERAAILQRTAGVIRARLAEMAHWNTAESGKTQADSMGDLQAAAALFEWYAEEAKRAYGRVVPSRKPGKRILVIKQPIGVVGTITAWNFPAYNPARCWAAALAAGCTVVGRPSEYTPLTAMGIAAALVEAGLPAGVLNLVNGAPEPIGQEMLNNPTCRKISFTGSTRVGRLLMDGASRTVTRLSLELGGNAPVLVFPDADLDLVAGQVVAAKCRNVGQVCVSPQRFFVHDSIVGALVERVAPQLAALRLGNGADPATQVGPLINARQRDRVEAMVAAARDAGDVIVTGGRRPAALKRGYFFEPTLARVRGDESPLFREEIFGPVMPVATFATTEEAIARANNTPYGLAAFVFTRDMATAVRAWEGLEFGLVAVNDWAVSTIEGPFPGWKQSGIGRECGPEGLEEYLETKQVGIGGL